MKVLTLAAAFAGAALAAVPADEMTDIPGFGPPLSKTYSGYLTFTRPSGVHHFHYVYSEAISTPSATSPLVLWLNGGPGCSSLDGMMYENGPYHVIEPITTSPPALYHNTFTWNNQTNMLWLESPCGVGFSYCDSAAGLRHNDTSTAGDNLAALVAFYTAFPELYSSPLYITGESYAGVYVPTLAQAILNYNHNPRPLPLQGIMVGNGCIGEAAGVCGGAAGSERFHMQEIWGHGLVSPQAYDAAVAQCGADFSRTGAACSQELSAIATAVGSINTYGIYSPCVFNDTPPSDEVMLATGRARVMRPLVGRAYELGLIGGPLACIDGGAVMAYFDRPDVKTAWHVSQDLQWSICNNNRSFAYSRTEQDERVDVYPDLVALGVRILIFNGEADNCVPWTDNQWWTASFALSSGMANTTAWRSWMVDSENVGGYITEYTPTGGATGSFAFATVRGAGHMVPETQPEAALKLFTNFIFSQPF